MRKVGQKIDEPSLRFMSVSRLLAIMAVLILFAKEGWAAPQPYLNSRPNLGSEDVAGLTRQIKNGLADLKNEVRNHESEIRVFEEKLHNQEASFEQLRQQITEDIQSQRDYVRASSINLEGKTETLDQTIKNLETLVRGLMADVKLMKSQANDSVAVLGQYKQKMTELEKLLETQSQHMHNLEAGMQSMLEVWQAKEATKEIAIRGGDGLKTYKVQPRDTLGEIAKSQKVSLQALREINHLTNDRIYVGQTLVIP